MLRFYFFTIYISSFLFGGIIRPEMGQHLNYIHVPLEWNQEPNGLYYQVQVDTVTTFQNPIINEFTEITTLLIDEHIKWQSSYFWRVRSHHGENQTSPWLSSVFHTKDPVLVDIEVNNYNLNIIQPGLTAFGGWAPSWRSAMVDANGNEIWNDDGFMIKLSEIDEFGRMYGFSLSQWPTYTGVKINADIVPIWHPNDTWVDDHEIIELSNGHFMGFTYDDRLGPIPSNNYWTEAFRDLGYTADDSTLEFMWRGHVITEWDKDKNIVWSWNAWDYFTTSDRDELGGTWAMAYHNSNQVYDWMHSNSIFFDEQDNHIYISTRHLSRITKIEYPSGNVIWNMGLPEPYMSTGDESICSDILFSWQHHVQKLENGNIVFFDNGNISWALFDITDPVSRVIEIDVINDNECEIIWEYNLPPNLFGSAGGGIQYLQNGNKLIYTLGDGNGTNEPKIFEISSDDDILWELNLPGHALHRPFRVPSLHPDIFSVVFDNYKEVVLNDDSLKGVIIDDNQHSLDFEIYNSSGYDQYYNYTLNDANGWFEEIIDTIHIQAYDHLELQYEPIIHGDSMTTINFTISPTYHQYRTKHYSKNVYFVESNLVSGISTLPLDFIVEDPYPNPFNANTWINIFPNEDQYVEVSIYDINGRIVRNLFNEYVSSSGRNITWDGRNDKGFIITTGIYIVKVLGDNYSYKKKIMFLK